MLATSIYRSAAWQSGERSPAALAAAVTAPSAITPLTLTEAFGLVATRLGAGAPAALQTAAEIPSWIAERLAASLAEGNLAGAQGLILAASGKAPALCAAMGAVVASRVLRLVDVVAAEMGVGAPATVTAEDVAAALASA